MLTSHLMIYVFSLFLGFVPGIFITESILDQVSRSLKMDVEQVKEANMYKPGDISYTVRGMVMGNI